MTSTKICEKCEKVKPAKGFVIGFNSPVDSMEAPVEEQICADCAKSEMEWGN